MPSFDDVLALDGFSSAENRRILNAEVARVPNARILEVGSYKGSTAAAMCWGNRVQSIHMVDNHSEFGDTRAELAGIVDLFNLPATLHDLNYFGPLPANVFDGTTFNVYLYDGPHTEDHHARELAVALPHLEREFLYMVDDFSWPEVRRGWERGIAENGVTLLSHLEYTSHTTNDADGYWNGLMVARCRQP